MKIRIVDEKDREWICNLFYERWGSLEIVTRGSIHHAKHLPGFIAIESEQPVGLITYTFMSGDCEIVSLNSIKPGKGIGSALVKSVIDIAFTKACKRIWLITTNDNTDALIFYQKMGFELVAIYRDTIKESRKMKPEIPLIGNHGIPIKDEIELELKIP